MKKSMLGAITILLYFAGLSGALAVTECTATTITEIQVTDTNTVVKRNNQWHLVGVYSDPGMREKLSALFSAQATGRNVILKFVNDGYDCDLETFSSRVYAVRVLNN